MFYEKYWQEKQLRKRRWASVFRKIVFHKIVSMMFYEKSFRKRFTWSNAKTLAVARNSILIASGQIFFETF